MYTVLTAQLHYRRQRAGLLRVLLQLTRQLFVIRIDLILLLAKGFFSLYALSARALRTVSVAESGREREIQRGEQKK